LRSLWRARRLVSVMVALCVFAAGSISAADDVLQAPLTIEDVTEQGALMLADGDQLCLAGIWVPTVGKRQDFTETWRSAWRSVVDEGNFFYQAEPPAKRNRYGCALTSVESADGKSLQHELLAAGWAAVDPFSASKETHAIDAMLALEMKAREAGHGIWMSPDAGPKKVDDLADWIGTRQLVEGQVRRVHVNKRYVYLNFGADWRTDFTARLNRAMIEEVPLDASDFEGRALRLRGVLEESRGPLMNISHLKQIEFLP